MTKSQIERLWISEGGDPKAAGTAAAVALAESGGRPTAVNDKNSDGSIDRGLFQINSVHGAQSTLDLRKNVRAAIAISSNGKNWHPWVTYNTGAYRKYASGGGSSSDTAPSAGPSSQPPNGTGPTYRTIPGKSLLPERQAAAASFLGQRGSSANQNLAFAQQISGLQDQPDQRVRVAGAGTQAANSTGSALPGRTGSAGLDYTARANALDSQHLPYQWGGGHGGKVNPYKATPVDCSGAVSAVLGIDPRVSGQFETFGKPGRAPGGKGVTIYANAHHVLMEVNGHFFGTSASNPGGGAGWIKRETISPQYLKGFTVRHTDA